MGERKKYVAKTLFGLEQVVKEELADIGIAKCRVTNRAVEFHATKEQLYRANLSFSAALNILEPIFSFKANNENEFYDQVKSYDWSTIFGLDDTFSISSTVRSEKFTHSQYIALKMKDAIVDRFRDETGRRPNVDSKTPDVKFNLSIREDKCTISIDTSGDALFKRGYRVETNLAPLNEMLAAGLIKLSGWDKQSTLMDPMCGAGTIPLEAAMMLLNVPPGFYRRDFGFFGFKDYDPEIWKRIKDEAQDNITESSVKIFGSDLAMKSVRKATSNLNNARDLKRNVRFRVEDATFIEQEKGATTVILNPPYGERIYKEEVDILYQRFGDNIAKNFKNCKVGVFSSNFEALDKIGLNKVKEYDLFNAAIKCKFQIFEV
jgi:putative N6-adenine-specific DNA methylase